MLRKSSFGFLAALLIASAASSTRADDVVTARAWDIEASAPATLRPHQYTLAECLALADRNFPTLWAARARLALAHAQLDEAKWTPWFQWSAQSTFGVIPPILGTVLYPQATLNSRILNNFGNLGDRRLQKDGLLGWAGGWLWTVIGSYDDWRLR